MLKLSECGFPKRRLWLTLKGISESIVELVRVVAQHEEILAPCPKCGRPEAFTLDYSSKWISEIRTYICMRCSSEIQVLNDQEPFL